ncbi:adhesion G protein-coupled receptor L3-like [Liolophura sinensis]|uniref:adhesion G protein-coupled receptor L3-like n=1 Tax=Liolophura sinensis TaxID=3198878 RepID=UPI003158DB19
MDTRTVWISLELVLLTLIVDSSGLQIRCGDGDWIQVHRGCYCFELEQKTWLEAKQECQNRGGFLLSIGSVAELENISKKLKPMIKDEDHLNWWVGLEADPVQAGRWKWADGGEFSRRVSPWSPGEPNNAGDKEKCVELNYKGKLNDAACSELNPFVCENMGHTTTTDMGTILTTTVQSSAETRQTSTELPVETDPSTAKENTVSQIRSESTRKRDTKGPPTRITTPRLPEAAPPNTTVQSTTISDEMEIITVPYTEKINEIITDLNEKQSAKTVAKAASSLATVITQKKILTSKEVALTARKLSELATKVDLTNSSAKEIEEVVSEVFKATSNLMSTNKTQTWSELSRKDQRESAELILQGVESSAFVFAKSIESPDTINKKEDNIEMELQVLGPEQLNKSKIVYEPEDKSDVFVLPSDMLKDNEDGGLTKVVFVTYHKIADLLQPEADKSGPDEGEVDRPSEAQQLVVSNVISVSVLGKTFQNLETPIKFTMKHTKKTQSYPGSGNPSCVFWKFAKSSETSGKWSEEGCGVVKTNSSHTVCECNHLTHFAVLMDVQGVKVSDDHDMPLQLITYAGCIVSAVCLVISWLTFQFLRCLHGERNSIHKNLVFCLFVAEMLFLFGIDKTCNKILCAVLAGLMHYFFLASFTWMFLEGVHIVVMIVQVFDAAKSPLLWYYLAGYGIPLTIVSVSSGVNYEGYGTEHYCWLSVDNLFIWSFAGPVAVILLVNATILTYAMSTVCKHSEYVIKEKTRSDSTRAWIQGALALEVLLGLTWVFGYFYINDKMVAMAYVFTVLNSLQGLFIFCFHCLLNNKVRKEYKRVLDISRVTTSTNTRSATRSSLHRKQDPSYEM